MEFRQPCQINRFTFKSHAVSHLLGNGLPTHPLPGGNRQRLPAMNGFYVTHAGKITAMDGLSNTIHAGLGLEFRLQPVRAGLGRAATGPPEGGTPNGGGDFKFEHLRFEMNGLVASCQVRNQTGDELLPPVPPSVKRGGNREWD